MIKITCNHCEMVIEIDPTIAKICPFCHHTFHIDVMKPEPKPPTNNSNAVFHIPDTDEGKEFIRLANKFMNRPQFRFKRQANNRAGWSAMYIYRQWMQEWVEETCPKCNGEYKKHDHRPDWWVELTCKHCNKGIHKFLSWFRLSYDGKQV